MKKQNILYFTIIPSPFQVEFINYLNEHSEKYTYVPIFMQDIPAYRKTWGESDMNFIILSDKNILKQYIEIKDIFKKFKPERIIVNQYNTLITLLTILLAIKNNIDYYMGPMENMKTKNCMIDFIKKTYFKIIAHKSKALFAIGNQAVVNYSRLYKGEVLNIPYTFDLKQLYKNDRKTISDSKKIVFLYSGRLVKFRNPLLVIECFAEVSKKYDNVKLLMSGQGVLRQKCDLLIESLGIQEKVKWKNDFNGWYDIHKNLYKEGNVLLALQHYSTWGLIIQEAMASGMGIIATRTMEAANELIVDNYNGFLVNLDKKEIISKMEKYIHSDKILESHIKRSKDIVNVVDLQNVGDNFLEFFEKGYICER